MCSSGLRPIKGPELSGKVAGVSAAGCPGGPAGTGSAMSGEGPPHMALAHSAIAVPL